MRIFLNVLLALLISGNTAFAQEESEKEGTGPFKPEHSFSVVVAHGRVFDGRDAEGNKKVLTLPVWGIDYNLKIAPKWTLGLHTDIVLETFSVKKHLEGGGGGEVVERTKPVAPALMGFYKPGSHWAFGFGFGGEFSKEEDYFLNRASIDYGVDIRNGWEVFGGLQYDFRWNAYDTWTIGIGISKKLGKSEE